MFIDVHFEPWPDQWAFLAGIRRIGRAQVEGIVRDAERTGRVLGVRLPPADEDDDQPWRTRSSGRQQSPALAGPLPQAIELVLGNQIYFESESLNPGLRNRLLRVAAFQNPELYQAQTMRLSTYGKPRVIACAEQHGRHVGLPRGCVEDVQTLLRTSA